MTSDSALALKSSLGMGESQASPAASALRDSLGLNKSATGSDAAQGLRQSLGITDKITTEPQATDDSLTGRIKQDYSNRIKEGQDAANAYVDGQQGALLTGLDFAGKIGVGTALDTVGEGIKSAASYAPRGVKDAVSSGVRFIGDNIQGTPIGDAATLDSNLYKGFAQRYPNAARHVEAAANIGSVLAPEIPVEGTALANTAVDAAKSGTKALVDTAKTGVNALVDNPPRSMQFALEKEAKEAKALPTAEAYKEKFADPEYAKMQSAGGALSTNATDKALQEARSGLKRDPKIAADEADRMIEDMTNGNNHVLKWSGDKTDIGTLQAKDVELNSLINRAYVSGDKNLARKYSIIQDSLRGARDSAVPGDIEGGVEGFNAWKMGNYHFGIQSDLAKLESIVSITKNMAQPANSLATRMNMLLNKQSKIAGWSDEEIAQAKKIAETTAAQDALKTGGSRLMNYAATGVGEAIGHGVGGTVGGALGAMAGLAAGHVGTSLVRDAAWASKMKQVDELRKMILSRKAPEMLSEAKPAPEPQKLLPPPQTQYITDARGSTRAMTPAEAEAAQTGRQRAKELGLTPDIQRLISKKDLRQRIGGDWDKLDQESQQKINDQVNKAWASNKSPLSSIITKAKQDVQDLLDAKGEKMGDVGMALLKARTGKKR